MIEGPSQKEKYDYVAVVPAITVGDARDLRALACLSGTNRGREPGESPTSASRNLREIRSGQRSVLLGHAAGRGRRQVLRVAQSAQIQYHWMDQRSIFLHSKGQPRQALESALKLGQVLEGGPGTWRCRSSQYPYK